MMLLKSIKIRRIHLLGTVLLLAFFLVATNTWVPSLWGPIENLIRPTRTVAEAIHDIAPKARPPVSAKYESKGLSYPPASLTLIAVKDEKRLELWSPDTEGHQIHIDDYPILGASGTGGPKMQEGDHQVPEGMYAIIGLNPNSSYHLSMKIDYPNAFDRKMARMDGRTDLGGDIFIHGYDVSVGCLAVGNDAIEELFVLVHDTGKDNARVVIAPYDFRTDGLRKLSGSLPRWTRTLYSEIESRLRPYM